MMGRLTSPTVGASSYRMAEGPADCAWHGKPSPLSWRVVSQTRACIVSVRRGMAGPPGVLRVWALAFCTFETWGGDEQ